MTTKTKEKWVVKDRLYELSKGKKPIIFTIPTAHSTRHPMMWFDEEKGYQRELRYATNQKSCFVDEQQGPCTMGRIVFRDGILRVKKENVALQQFLSLYHPYLKKNIYQEYKPVQQATNEVEWIEFEADAVNLARSLDVNQIEAILRVEIGEKVNKLSSSELKRDILVFAKRNPRLFINLANDENTELRNFGAKAVEAKIINLSNDQRTFTMGKSGRKVLTVPFDEHPYSALAAYFKTDEGMELYKNIEKRLNK